MSRVTTTDAPRGCPHLDENDPRCGSRFGLSRLDQAFAVCFGAYRGCPMYHQLQREARNACAPPRAEPPLIHITISTEPDAVPLRATGS